MQRTAAALVRADNPAQLSMRVLANHGADTRFAFLRGRWSQAWTRIRKDAEDERMKQEAEKAKEKEQAGLGGLAGYGDSGSEAEEDEEDEAEVADAAGEPRDDTLPKGGSGPRATRGGGRASGAQSTRTRVVGEEAGSEAFLSNFMTSSSTLPTHLRSSSTH